MKMFDTSLKDSNEGVLTDDHSLDLFGFLILLRYSKVMALYKYVFSW